MKCLLVTYKLYANKFINEVSEQKFLDFIQDIKVCQKRFFFHKIRSNVQSSIFKIKCLFVTYKYKLIYKRSIGTKSSRFYSGY